MKKSINNNYNMKAEPRSDIFRKFQKVFRYLFNDAMHYDKNLYVEQSSDRYEEEFDAFTTSYVNDVRYFIGYTGCGKSTFIRHYFGLENISPKISKNNDTLIIPSFWDGKGIDKDKYEKKIVKHVSNSIRAAILSINKNKGVTFPYNELIEFHEYIQKTRGDIIATLNAEEYQEFGSDIIKVISKILSKTERDWPIEYASSSLKYFVEKYSEINRVIFIIDDVETLDATALSFLINTYYRLYDCFQNTAKKEIIVNLLISLRPHSFRYLREYGMMHEKIIAYGNHLESKCYQIVKNDIPNIRDIFMKRFEKASEKIEPGNIDTWQTNKNYLYSLINNIEKRYIDIITDLCHMNIRAIFDCLQLILSNRTWCQESKSLSLYPEVRINEYNFNNIVNVLRTLSCGENSVYTGRRNIQFNASDLDNMQSRPAFDGSDVFIPNILNNIYTGECDVTTIYIMFYLENKFSSTDKTPANSEFISINDLLDELTFVFRNNDRGHLLDIIIYLFKNRIIRKSIINRDNPNTINELDCNTYIYLTRKGSRLLKLLKEDSILLEIFREDIVREYKDDEVCKSSFELVTSNNRTSLFNDLIHLAREIYQEEDSFISKSLNVNERKCNDFFDRNNIFRLSIDICRGLSITFDCVKNLDTIDSIKEHLRELISDIEQRKNEISVKYLD